MAGIEWPFTRLGVTFFEGTLPRLVRAVEKLANELERYNNLMEKKNADENK
jgi:hypothetical protein